MREVDMRDNRREVDIDKGGSRDKRIVERNIEM